MPMKQVEVVLAKDIAEKQGMMEFADATKMTDFVRKEDVEKLYRETDYMAYFKLQFDKLPTFSCEPVTKEAIDEMKKERGYRYGGRDIKIICDALDEVFARFGVKGGR